MTQSCFHNSAWYQAITLAERIASLSNATCTASESQIDAGLAKRRLERWRSQPPFEDDAHFARRLASDNLTEDLFSVILGEPIEAVRNRIPQLPGWLNELAEAFSGPISDSTTKIPLPAALRDQPAAGFLEAIAPLVSHSRLRLRDGVQKLAQTRTYPPFDPDTIEDMLFADLPIELLTMLSRTMALELNVARLQGLLDGDTAEQRFQSFLRRVRERDAVLAVLQEYPVLARQLVTCLDNWVNFCLEFLSHLCTDWDSLQTTFNPDGDPGVLVHVNSGVSDKHRGGRSVLIIKFVSGFQIVYKPKPLSIDTHFQDLLKWVNRLGDHAPFRTIKILDCKTHGWIEFVSAETCVSFDEVHRFYQRQGGYLALLFALEATDFHSENLIAAGEHPVLVDLESLLHPRIRGNDSALPDLTEEAMAHSVVRVGLLPDRVWVKADYEGIDLSGLGAAPGQTTPFRSPYWEDAGTDQMRLARRRTPSEGNFNRPTLNGAEVNVLDYTESIVAGFVSVYRLLLKHRNVLLSEDGPLARFAEDEVRVIIRPTRIYSLLLYESFHPDLRRNALDRDRFFDRLWVDIERRPSLAKVISAERRDLERGDIPIFTTRPFSRDLWTSENERIPDFFDEPCIANVRRMIERLSEDDLERQSWFIRASMATLFTGIEGVEERYVLSEPQEIASREQLRERLLTGARSIGDRLNMLALGSEEAGWVGLTLSNERRWSLFPSSIDLYDGLPGIALFLSYLGAVTQEARYTRLARAAMPALRRRLKRNKPHLKSIGAFDGWGGIIYTLAHLGALWNDSGLLAEAEQIVDLLPPLIEQDDQLDIIGGAAGCIGGLTSLYHCVPSQKTLDTAIQCGDRLIARAKPMESGVAWVTPIPATKPLAGFSHGAAGIAWALLQLYRLTGKERFRTTALQAEAYERSIFSRENENWPDLRQFDTAGQTTDGDQYFLTTWCYGAPGIGLARLSSIEQVDGATIRAEIDTSLRTTMSHGFGLNHSLCHGDIGNLELLLQASSVLDKPEWGFQVERIATMILDSFDRYGWLCGNPQRVESPGLMTGLAGIGYGLLRLAEPSRVPSVLVLALPWCGKDKTTWQR
ncbi:MAG TPA: type 2 lanthipeptide synthetase LanM family protein [Pyrinomonadaceae bacterium]|nr:type 2 lanthipeptide synthetase LanM family protein [Pyrinomonadaceae bacterium]